jgi:hypothetical protein
MDSKLLDGDQKAISLPPDDWVNGQPKATEIGLITIRPWWPKFRSPINQSLVSDQIFSIAFKHEEWWLNCFGW